MGQVGTRDTLREYVTEYEEKMVQNTNLDEISAEIGFTATNILVIWFGGDYLSVPGRAVENSALGKLIGGPALRRLVARYSGQRLWIGTGTGVQRAARDRAIAERLARGESKADIAEATGLTPRRVEQIRTRLLADKGVELAREKLPRPSPEGV